MSDKSDYLEQKLIDHTLRNTAYTSPTTVYAALFTAAPGETGGGTEVATGAYARTAITFGAGSQVSGAFKVTNSADVTFPTATADWGVITHAGIFDAATVGNLLYYKALTASKTVSNGDTFKFLATNLTVSEA